MSATLVEAAPAAPANAPRRATLALARVEATRLLRNPLTVVGVVMVVGFWVSNVITNQANRYPVLQDVDRGTQLAVMLLLGGAALIAGNLAVLREHRHGTTGLGQVLLLSTRARTVAHLLALLPLTALAVLLVTGWIVALELLTPAVGQPNPYELATGPATVLLLGALGVLLGRLTRSAVAAPLAVLALLASMVVVPVVVGETAGQWWQLVVAQGEQTFLAPAPAYLMARPAGPHLIYLLGLAALLAVLALLRTGARTVRMVVAVVVAAALAVAGGLAQLGPVPAAVKAARTAAMNHPDQHQVCRTLDGVRYCAFPDFSAWAPAWNRVVQRVLAATPAEHRASLAVRQRLILGDVQGGNMVSVNIPAVQRTWQADDAAAGTPGAVSVGTQWGDSRSAAALAGLVAYRLIGQSAGQTMLCGGVGVLTVWLAGQSGAEVRTGLVKLLEDSSEGWHPNDGAAVVLTGPDQGVLALGPTGMPVVAIPAAEATVGLNALNAVAASRLASLWAALVAAPTAAAAAQVLGVPAPAAGASGPLGKC